jgi:hypothetical protein
MRQPTHTKLPYVYIYICIYICIIICIHTITDEYDIYIYICRNLFQDVSEEKVRGFQVGLQADSDWVLTR